MPSETPAPKTPVRRPLSPHLQIYKPQITSATSILHRITGVGLSVGILIAVAWLAALAGGEESYAVFLALARMPVAQIILFALTAALFYHLLNGIRHLFWDAGIGLEIKTAVRWGYLVLFGAIVLTVFVWLKIYGVAP